MRFVVVVRSAGAALAFIAASGIGKQPPVIGLIEFEQNDVRVIERNG